jgi:hypothetical protein
VRAVSLEKKKANYICAGGSSTPGTARCNFAVDARRPSEVARCSCAADARSPHVCVCIRLKSKLKLNLDSCAARAYLKKAASLVKYSSYTRCVVLESVFTILYSSDSTVHIASDTYWCDETPHLGFLLSSRR